VERSCFTIDLGAIRRNAEALLSAAGGAELWAVVKAEGYGHGAVDVSRAALDAGASALCVATLPEALHLRAGLRNARVIVMGPVSEREIGEARAARLKGARIVFDVVTVTGTENLMMAAALAGRPVDVDACRRKDPLPEPLAPGVRVLRGERPRQFDPASSRLEVELMLTADRFEVPHEIGFDGGRQHRETVSVPFPGAHHDLVARDINILHA